MQTISKLYWGFDDDATAVGALTTGYSVLKKIKINMGSIKNDDSTSQNHRGFMKSIRIRVTSGAATLTALNWKLCSDVLCDDVVIQDSALTPQVGGSTNTKYTASGTIDIPLRHPTGGDVYYLLCYGNVAMTVSSVEFGWTE